MPLFSIGIDAIFIMTKYVFRYCISRNAEKKTGAYCMTIQDMVDVLHAKVLCGADRLDTKVHTACCSDLMSDVLAFVNEKTVLITGLTNAHVLRTADMLDLKCLVFARGKIPGNDILEQAEEQGLVVIVTPATAFSACGLLYEAGLRGVPIEWPESEARL